MHKIEKLAYQMQTACSMPHRGVLAMVFSLMLAGCNSPGDGTETLGAASGTFVPTKTAASVSGSASENSQALEQLSALSRPKSDAYKIGPQDFLDINVFSVPALSRQTQVSGDGTINMPLLGEIQAAGKTSQQLERELISKLGARYLQNPQVAISIKEYNSQRYTVEGAVKKPGIFQIKSHTTLLQSISVAEGLDKDTASSSVVIFRQQGGQRLAARFNLDSVRDGTSADPDIQEGDVIVVGTSASKTAFQNVVKLLPVASLFKPF